MRQGPIAAAIHVRMLRRKARTGCFLALDRRDAAGRTILVEGIASGGVRAAAVLRLPSTLALEERAASSTDGAVLPLEQGGYPKGTWGAAD
ncbi:MAG: hypothetical protein N3C12_00705 [Candidatus Binatia bacterium]|nr:hypothetical protein [Candidatus Binatia bacterium]